MKREFCARCAIKHLGQARALSKELTQGYPHHVWFALGHMAEASDEITELMPSEAAAIREARLAWEQALRDKNVEYRPEFQRLMYLVAEGAMLEETL